MSTIRVDQVHTQQVQQHPENQQVEVQQQRVALNQETTFEHRSLRPSERPGSLDGLGLGSESVARLDALFAGMGPEQQDQVRAAGAKLMQAINNEVKNNPEGVESAQLSEDMTVALETMVGALSADDDIDPMDAMNGSMYAALEGVQEDLHTMASNVHKQNQVSQNLRESMADIRDGIANWPEGVETQEFTWIEVQYDAAGNATMVEHTGHLNKEQAANLLEKLDGQLQTNRDFSQMMQLELQDLMNKQAEYTQSITSMMKAMHDMLMAIIRNIS